MLNQDLEINKKLIPYSISFEQNEAEMSLTEHLEEVRQRAYWSLSLLLTTIISCVLTYLSLSLLELSPIMGSKWWPRRHLQHQVVIQNCPCLPYFKGVISKWNGWTLLKLVIYSQRYSKTQISTVNIMLLGHHQINRSVALPAGNDKAQSLHFS